MVCARRARCSNAGRRPAAPHMALVNSSNSTASRSKRFQKLAEEGGAVADDARPSVRFHFNSRPRDLRARHSLTAATSSHFDENMRVCRVC